MFRIIMITTESNERQLLENLIINIEKADVPSCMGNFYLDPCLHKVGKVGVYAFSKRENGGKLVQGFDTDIELEYDYNKIYDIFVTGPRIGSSKEEVIKVETNY